MESNHRAGKSVAAAAAAAALALTIQGSAAVLTPPIQADISTQSISAPDANKAGPVAVAKPPEDRSQSCSAQCLTALANRYLDALVRRDFKGLPTAPNLLVAENGHATRIGEGLWKVLEKLDSGKAYFADPIAGQIVVITTLEESAHQPFIFLLRLKVEDQLIAEVESMVTADLNAAQHFRPDNLANFDPIMLAAVPAEKRLSREQLISIHKNSWYDTPLTPAISVGDGCIHWENGDRLANFKCGTSQAFRPGGLSYAHRAIRRVVVDQERGVVVTYVLKDTTPYLNPNPPDFERTPLFYQCPLTLYLVEMSKYEGGNKILANHVFMNAQEANMPAVFVE